MSPDNIGKPVLVLVRGKVTDGERHRIILSNSFLVDEIASRFRGRRGIPFEELTSVGMIGLVYAAQYAGKVRSFKEYAASCIENRLRKFIDGWQQMVSGSPETLPEREFWEWAVWSHAAPYEQWNSLSATPEEIVAGFLDLNSTRSAIRSAMIGLGPMARGIINARFFREPPQDLRSISREYEISYSKTVRIIWASLKTIREKLESTAKKTA